MKLALNILIIIFASYCLAITNWNVNVTKSSGNGWDYLDYVGNLQGGGISETDIIWVASNSKATIQDGTQGAPFTNLSQTVIDSSNGKTIFILPGKYYINGEIIVSAKVVKIVGASLAPESVHIINVHGTNSMFVSDFIWTNEPTSLYIANVTLTSSNTPYTWPAAYRSVGGAICGGGQRSLTTTYLTNRFEYNIYAENCVFKDCIRWSSVGIATRLRSPGASYIKARNCKFIDCLTKDYAAAAIGSYLENCEFINCIGGYSNIAATCSTTLACYLKNCIFRNCRNINRSSAGTGYGAALGGSIINCQFYNCWSSNGFGAYYCSTPFAQYVEDFRVECYNNYVSNCYSVQAPSQPFYGVNAAFIPGTSMGGESYHTPAIYFRDRVFIHNNTFVDCNKDNRAAVLTQTIRNDTNSVAYCGTNIIYPSGFTLINSSITNGSLSYSNLYLYSTITNDVFVPELFINTESLY